MKGHGEVSENGSSSPGEGTREVDRGTLRGLLPIIGDSVGVKISNPLDR